MNIIPVIAKADTISKSELHKFKIKIMSELVSNGVQIYQFPTDDETVSKINTAMNVSIHNSELSSGLYMSCLLLKHFGLFTFGLNTSFKIHFL